VKLPRPASRILALLLGILAILALVMPGAGSATATSLRISEGAGTVFPERSFELSVPPGSPPQPSAIHVSENGRPITGAVITPVAQAATGNFGVVLAIDVGPSMRGVPLARAMDAARALAAQRMGNQEIGVVTFDQSATVSLPLTNDPETIANTLERAPQVGSAAYIYNGLTLAIQQLANAKIAAGAVILLSDGASEGGRSKHKLTASSVGAAASAAHVAIYTVGLHDSSYTPERMSLLARVGGGAFIESTSAQLAGVFTQIEARLTSAYLIRYSSPAPPGRTVNVSVTVDGIPGAATLSYTTPGSVLRATKHAKHESFWLSSAALVLLSSLAALVLGFGLFALLAPRLFGGQLRKRVGEFTASGPVDPRDIADERTRAPLARLTQRLENVAWWKTFERDVEIARIGRSATELAAVGLLATLAGAILLGIIFSTAVVSVIALFFGPAVVRGYVTHRLRKERDLFAEQLPSHLQEVASAMRAGHSLVAGITTMAREAAEPSHGEWQQVVADEQLGVPLNEAMRPVAERMDSDDMNQVALVASLHHRTGGNMAEVLERVADSVRERAELRRELRSLTAQARLSRYIVTSLPPCVALVITLLDPGYIGPLFHTTGGVVLVFVAVGLLAGAALVMRRITDIEV